jgi:putative membrane protein
VLIVAHAGQAVAPHDLATAWHLDPLLAGALVVAGWLYHRGRAPAPASPDDRWRTAAFAAGLLAVAAALLSPLEALAGALASAHMVQHLLLVVVAPPLLALAAPSRRLLRGSPRLLRRRTAAWRRRLGLTPAVLRRLQHPAAVWLLHVAVLWTWHAAVLYGAALRDPRVHVAEHAGFFLTALLFWSVVAAAGRRHGVSHGTALLLVFAMALQSVFLAALLTFAPTPWYDGYAATTGVWGLTPLADQQLAGVIMWVPASAVHVAAALVLVVRSLSAGEQRPGPVMNSRTVP